MQQDSITKKGESLAMAVEFFLLMQGLTENNVCLVHTLSGRAGP